MKKFLAIIIVCLFIFSACEKTDNGNSEHSTTTNAKDNTVSIDKEDDLYSRLITAVCSDGDGVYILTPYMIEDPNGTFFTSFLKGDGTYGHKRYKEVSQDIQYIDGTTLRRIVLCNKPDCRHSDDTCNAYLPPVQGIVTEESKIKRMDSRIFYTGGRLYTIDIYGMVTVMKSDGTEHQAVMEIDGKYDVSVLYLFNNKVYAQATCMPEYDSGTEQFFGDKDLRQVLLEIDLQNKICKELYDFQNEPDTRFLGLYRDKAYYFYCSPGQALSSNTQAAIDAQENGHTVKLYYYDLQTLERHYVYENGKSYDLDTVTLAENHIFYHNRRTKQLKMIDLDTGRESVLLSELNGYIRFLLNQTLDGNKLFFVKDNNLTDSYADPPKENETVYVDIESRKIKKLEYQYTDSEGLSTLYDITAVTEGYYIVEKDASDTPVPVLTAIPKSDFLNNRFDGAILITTE